MVVGQPRAHSGEVVGHPQVRWPGNLGVVGRGGRGTLGGRTRWAGNLGVVGQGGRATSGKVVGQPRGKVVGQPRVVGQPWAVLQGCRATSGTLGRGGRATSGEVVGQPLGGRAPAGEVVGHPRGGRATSVEVVGQPRGGRATVRQGGRATPWWWGNLGHTQARWSGTLK